MLMKTKMILMALCAVLPGIDLCHAMTIKYRDGHALVCDVLAKDDTNLIVRTIKGVQTNTWRQLTSESFKAVHPELYQRLTQQVLERKKQQADEMKAKGMIQVGGKWVDKKTYEKAQLARLRLAVNAAERAGDYRKAPNQPRNYSRDIKMRTSVGELCVKVDGLNHATTNKLKVEVEHFIIWRDSRYTTFNSFGPHQEPRNDKVIKSETFCGEISIARRYQTPTYEQFQYNWRYDTQERWGYESKGFSLNIWLNGELICEQKRGSKPVYHYVTKW